MKRINPNTGVFEKQEGLFEILFDLWTPDWD